MKTEREREREREGGGGLKGSAHFALQILVKRMGMLEYKSWHTSIDAYTTKRVQSTKGQGQGVVTNTCT